LPSTPKTPTSEFFAYPLIEIHATAVWFGWFSVPRSVAIPLGGRRPWSTLLGLQRLLQPLLPLPILVEVFGFFRKIERLPLGKPLPNLPAIPRRFAPPRKHVVHRLDHMDVVKNYGNAWRMFKHGPDIGDAHIRRYRVLKAGQTQLVETPVYPGERFRISLSTSQQMPNNLATSSIVIALVSARTKRSNELLGVPSS
jgi:hypothetical protein